MQGLRRLANGLILRGVGVGHLGQSAQTGSRVESALSTTPVADMQGF